MGNRFKLVVPGDVTRLPGMHTLMADRTENHKVNYIPNVPYVERPEEIAKAVACKLS